MSWKGKMENEKSKSRGEGEEGSGQFILERAETRCLVRLVSKQITKQFLVAESSGLTRNR